MHHKNRFNLCNISYVKTITNLEAEMDRESKIVFLIPNRSESLPKNGCEKNWAFCSLKYDSYYMNSFL